MEVNGDAIYETRKREVSSQMNGEQKLFFTTKAGAVFCLFNQWTDEINIDMLDSEEVAEVSLLGWEGNIPWVTEGQKLKIQLPKMGLDEIPCFHAWTLQIRLK